ncbi:hypothetical protein [Streptomyces tendae]|uniref:hypothetical protein n=1 Tax=Streptomyces tendae TaxID=1932 RepID=UPI0033CD3BB9
MPRRTTSTSRGREPPPPHATGVGVSSAGHDWPHPAGVLSAAFAMGAEFASSGAACRALSMPFYMENLLGQLDSIRGQGACSLACG